jgi:2-(1,2-epoxy-1,2-dihydrophenyl)acetyl-CoA isomerase
MTQTLVLLTVNDGGATVKLNDPARLNPLSLALQEQLLASFEQVRGDRSVRVLVPRSPHE